MKLQTLIRAGNPLASPAEQLRILQDHSVLNVSPFSKKLEEQGASPLLRQQLTTLQINVGKVCNQTCTHCHVDAGPDRRESMNHETAKQVVDFLARSGVVTLDITGGAPEMNPNFRLLVQEARSLDKQVIDRCNLTILLARGFTDLPAFLAEHQVHIIASLPCYLEENCDSQRGSGVFVKSIEAIRKLNKLGYGQPGSNLRLDLVYNPTGLGLPPEQTQLEAAFKGELDTRFRIQFNRLLTITNMPISRFLDDLLRRGKYEAYLTKLANSFNSETIDQLMCRSMLSVDWNGFIYDCDFNQMLDLAVNDGDGRLHISNLTDELLADRAIRTANHCYGCTAGCGSSCGGSLIA
ncbi:MAG TPA: arsenosugar biosynthesis radical SAM protein ArsS [Pirellulaceae bacterium]|nr:arsenosugar biosynthesis radical SAM protein ArsS [Pirellulaceae bacterium]HMO94067.1 arsenosugar biosynthesis radical SAM protein ArsS [Pirellulaceae bacterium]HMP70925.1 arsenosugar biosynthesis radical SAM protein ArsS [Pirellulaceae bacterium]